MTSTADYPSSSEDDDSLEDEKVPGGSFRNGEFQGRLFKWTNYLHGWQERHLKLQNGFLNYYKNEFDIALGCRGALSVIQAIIQVSSLSLNVVSNVFPSISSLTNSTIVDLTSASVIPCGIFERIVPKIVNVGHMLSKNTNYCVKENRVMPVKSVFDDIPVWDHWHRRPVPALPRQDHFE